MQEVRRLSFAVVLIFVTAMVYGQQESKSKPNHSSKILAKQTGTRFELSNEQFYAPAKPKRDPGGLLVAGANSSEAIRKCKSINGLTLAELESRMRPNNSDAKGSLAGFLGKKEQLLDVLVADNDFVLQCGLSHRDLAIPLLQITNRATKLGMFRPVEFEHAGTKWRVLVKGTRGYQFSPFDDGTKTNIDVELTNLDSKETLKFSGLVPLMIERYGFYEGKGTPYRLEPSQIIKVLGLPSKKAEDSSKGKKAKAGKQSG